MRHDTKIFHSKDVNPDILEGKTVAVIGYGNQGRAQALNLRDNRIDVIVGNRDDPYKQLPAQDGFELLDIPSAVYRSQVIFLLIPDENLPEVYATLIEPNLIPGSALVFASGYNIAFDLLQVQSEVDILLIAPRMIGVGVRERFLTGEGFYTFVGVHQDASGDAEEILLALTNGIGGLIKPAIEVTFKQEATLDLFNEQAFGPAFGRVLLTSISVLIEQGLPPEAALIEMYMSEEMAYTYRKMAKTGLVKQTLYHSQTSQYGAMSRSIRFMNLGIKERMDHIFTEIDNGSFAKEWSSPITRLKFAAIKFFAMRQAINCIEKSVRETLGLKVENIYDSPKNVQDILNDPELCIELESFEDSFEF